MKPNPFFFAPLKLCHLFSFSDIVSLHCPLPCLHPLLLSVLYPPFFDCLCPLLLTLCKCRKGNTINYILLNCKTVWNKLLGSNMVYCDVKWGRIPEAACWGFWASLLCPLLLPPSFFSFLLIVDFILQLLHSPPPLYFYNKIHWIITLSILELPVSRPVCIYY